MSSTNTTDKLAINIPIAIDDVIQCEVDDKIKSNTNDNTECVMALLNLLMAITMAILAWML